MRKGRIFQWILAMIIAALLFQYSNNLTTKIPDAEKQVITVNAPEDMEKAFKYVLENTELKATHKIVMTDQDDANICIGYGKQNDESFQKIAYSPFVVVYNGSNDKFKKLKEAEVFVPSPYNSDNYEVNFLKIILEAIGEGKWANFDVEIESELKVFYPSIDSMYWNDFHDFLLVTVNNGIYPENAEEMQKAEELIEKFQKSKYTEGVTDFSEQVLRTGGFPDSAIYIFTEKDVFDICSAQGRTADIYYPTNVVYFNYYIKGDEIGIQLVDNLDKCKAIFSEHTFYGYLKMKGYRSAKYPALGNVSDRAHYNRDEYNVVRIPTTVESNTMSTDPTVSTNSTDSISE